MAVFTYVARTAEGRKVDGVVRAASREAAQAELRKKNLTVQHLGEQKAARKAGFLFGPPRPHVGSKDIAVLTRQLSTMISAGIPLLESMEILQEQATDPGFKISLSKIIDRVRAGSDFSTALAEHPKIFHRVYVNMVKAGEASGQLDTILQRLAEYMEATEVLKREIKAAMTYPVVSLFLILGITTGLVVGIVPKFKAIFEQMKIQDMPAPTLLLMKVSDVLRAHFLETLGVWAAVGIVFLMAIRTRRGRRYWHRFLLSMPVFGPLVRKIAISRFSRTFATLIQSGVPILGALDIVASTSGNVLVEEAVLKAREAVSKGETLGEPLAATRVFPPMVSRMIAIGEKTGAMEQLLVKISEFYDQEVRAAVKGLTALIEPLLILMMGLIVGSVVLAIFLPILKIQEVLGK